MAEVTAFTAERSQAIEDGAITDAHLSGDDLVLTPTGFATDPVGYPEINVGSVRGPQGIQGPVGEVTEAELADAISESEAVTRVPAGAMTMFAGAVAPTGYLLCDGADYDRTIYADLFAVLGTTYGVGNGTTTFNLPDMRSRFPVGKGVGTWSDTLNEKGGSKDSTLVTHTHTGPSHTHSIDHNHPSAATSSDGAHAHGIPAPADVTAGYELRSFAQDTAAGTNGNIGWGLDAAAGNVVVTDTESAHSHTVDLPNLTGTSGSGGTGATGNPSGTHAAATDTNLPPYITLNFIIKI